MDRDPVARHQNVGAPAAALAPATPAHDRTLPLDTLRTGDVIAGRFVVRRTLGRGGMGEVYAADDMELREPVALKTLLAPHTADESDLARFRREIHLARRISHSNVCRVHDIFRHQTALGEIVVLSMELLEGETLSDRLLRDPRLDRAEMLSIAQQVMAALGAMHAASIIHRDLKSSNIMLVPDHREVTGHRAVVMDFGLARRDAGNRSDNATTATGRILGTPAYLAPEQVEGGTLGPWTDVYAFGVVLFEMACGRLPFQGNSPLETAVQRLNQPPPRPGDLVIDLPAEWEALILRCLARHPADRFRSADGALAALRLLSDGSKDATVALRRVDRRATRVRALAGVSLILAFGAVLTIWRPRIFPPAPASQRAELAPAAVATDVTGLIRVSREALARGDLQGAYESLREAIRANPNDPELRKEVEALRAAGERLVEGIVKLRGVQGLEPADALAGRNQFKGGPRPPGAIENMEAAAGWAEADRLHKSGRTIEAVGALVKVHQLLLARAPGTASPPETVSQPQPGGGSVAPGGRGSPAATAQVPAVRTPALSFTTVTGAPRDPVNPRVLAVLETLDRYGLAYQSREVSQVIRVVPSMTDQQIEQLRTTFDGVTAYEVEIRDPKVQIEVGAAIASARAVVVRRLTPRLGSIQTYETETEFRLRLDGDQYVISDLTVP